MKKFNMYSMTGVTEEDNKALLECIDDEIELWVNESGQVFSEGGSYIADYKDVGNDCGVGC